MKQSTLKLAAYVIAGIGFGLNIISGCLADKQLDIIVDEKVNAALEKKES